MNSLTKKIGPAEVKCRCVTIPADKRYVFPGPGAEFDLIEGNTTHRAKLDTQFRLRSASWFRQHKGIKAGDEINFIQENGCVRVSFSRLLFQPESEGFKLSHEILNSIESHEIEGILRIEDSKIVIEIGEHLEATEIVYRRKRIQAS
jgi:hypothetical protein